MNVRREREEEVRREREEEGEGGGGKRAKCMMGCESLEVQQERRNN